MQVGFKSDKGIKRRNNEDAYFIVPSDNVYIVADGVGGNNAGEIASRTAVSIIAEYIRLNPIKEKNTEDALRDYFMDCLSGVNSEIYSTANRHPENEGMATTVVIAYIVGKSAYIVNVGDSRAYVMRNGELMCVTQDHTYVAQLIRDGVITPEEAKSHPRRHMITRAVGGEAEIVPDFFRVELEDGDKVMLCTDGLYGELGDERMAKIISESANMNDACKKLVEAANRAGGRDNITVVCLGI